MRQTGFRSQYDSSTPATPRHSDEYSTTPGNHNPSLGTATAAAVLAELHGIKSEREVDMEGVSLFFLLDATGAL